jgi:hypothetical protein
VTVEEAARRAVRTAHDETVEALASVKILGRSIRLPGWPEERINRVADALADVVRAVVAEREAEVPRRRRAS